MIVFLVTLEEVGGEVIYQSNTPAANATQAEMEAGRELKRKVAEFGEWMRKKYPGLKNNPWKISPDRGN